VFSTFSEFLQDRDTNAIRNQRHGTTADFRAFHETRSVEFKRVHFRVEGESPSKAFNSRKGLVLATNEQEAQAMLEQSDPDWAVALADAQSRSCLKRCQQLNTTVIYEYRPPAVGECSE